MKFFSTNDDVSAITCSEEAGGCTAKDIAKLAGVSTTTVSRVTSGSINVSSETRKKVQSAILTLQYRPNFYAAELRRAGRRTQIDREERVQAQINQKGLPQVPPEKAAQLEEATIERLCLLEEEYSKLKKQIAALRAAIDL